MLCLWGGVGEGKLNSFVETKPLSKATNVLIRNETAVNYSARSHCFRTSFHYLFHFALFEAEEYNATIVKTQTHLWQSACACNVLITPWHVFILFFRMSQWAGSQPVALSHSLSWSSTRCRASFTSTVWMELVVMKPFRVTLWWLTCQAHHAWLSMTCGAQSDRDLFGHCHSHHLWPAWTVFFFFHMKRCIKNF